MSDFLRDLRGFLRAMAECYFGKRCEYCWRRATGGVMAGFVSIHCCRRHERRAAEDLLEVTS